ncbi:hypothetical protein KM043_008917 [Ampulex compressa]|nr:hypothetical protein KM043_008917 [Ampulex compressa]
MQPARIDTSVERTGCRAPRGTLSFLHYDSYPPLVEIFEEQVVGTFDSSRSRPGKINPRLRNRRAAVDPSLNCAAVQKDGTGNDATDILDEETNDAQTLGNVEVPLKGLPFERIPRDTPCFFCTIQIHLPSSNPPCGRRSKRLQNGETPVSESLGRRVKASVRFARLEESRRIVRE